LEIGVSINRAITVLIANNPFKLIVRFFFEQEGTKFTV
jgi:hypothetical protein